MKKLVFNFLCLFLLISTATEAGVNIKNGNYYVSYTDIVFARSAMGLEISRTYNSKIADNGWYGSGWGSEYETFLHTMPGGGAVIHWNGSGIRTYFKPAEWDMDQITEAVDQIVALEKEAGKVSTPDQIMELRNKLLNSLELRYAYWRIYLGKGSVSEYELRPGTRLYTYKGTLSRVTVTDSGFSTTYLTDSTRVYFDQTGKLTRLEDPAGNFLVLTYGKSGFIRFIEDSDHNRLTFTCDKNGRVLRTEDQNGQYATYEYDASQNLLYSRDMDGNEYRHTYDSRNNMTSISYSDGTRATMEYNANSSIISYKDRKGYVTEYEYPGTSSLDYGTIVTSINPQDVVTLKTLYWFTEKRNEVGTTYLNRTMVVTNDVDTLVKIYNDRSILDTLIHNDTIWGYENTVKGDLAKVSSNKGYWMEPEKVDEGIGRIGDSAGGLDFRYGPDGKPLSVLTSAGTEIPYPYPHDRPDLQADISRIRTHIRLLNHWQDCSCYAGKWK